MRKNISRRDFIKKTATFTAGIGLSNKLYSSTINEHSFNKEKIISINKKPDIPFVPRKVASWWTSIDDLLWSEKKIKDKVKKRAEAFANANIDTAINYGFHARFDFSNYFGQMNEYFAFVKEELHKYNIKYIDHYSCNHVERPKNKEDFDKLHRTQRHHVLLFHDPIAAKYAQYEGHLFQEICEVDIITGSRGYAEQYQFEAFCHNNPAFLDMHKKYLLRLINEVDFDAYEIDDMCDYVGLRACGCKYCRERFKREYGHDIPSIDDKSFWGDMSKSMLEWGNYENPAFRDWIKMKDDIIADHVQMIKNTIGNKPLFTCCSSTGPITLNSISLNLERIANKVDFFMLENVGINIHSVNWMDKDAEAMMQKDIAEKRGKSPAIALSYSIYEDGGYLGWSLARFWGVANWASTFQHRVLDEDPIDAIETEDMVRPFNNWETKYSDLNHYHSEDYPEVRLVYNYYCRINGWRDQQGKEHWDRVKSWSKYLINNNIGYRIVRYEELSNLSLLNEEKTPLIIDGCACISDQQFIAINGYLSNGGIVCIAPPFGLYDEKGNMREIPLWNKLLQKKYNNLFIIPSSLESNPLNNLIENGALFPLVNQISGDKGWAIRLRKYGDKTVIHFLNTKLRAIPKCDVKDISNIPVIKNIKSNIIDNNVTFVVRKKIFPPTLKLFSPELGGGFREIKIENKNNEVILDVDLNGISIYAIAQ